MRYRLCLVNLATSRNTFWYGVFKSVDDALSNLNKTRGDVDELKADSSSMYLFRHKTPVDIKRRRSLLIILDETHPLFNLTTLQDDTYHNQGLQSIPDRFVDMISDYTKNMLEDIADLYSNR